MLWRFQNIADCLVTDCVAKFAQFTLNSVEAPIVIFLRKPNNETFKFSIDSWSAAATIRIIRPLALHQLTVPAKNSLWLEDPNDLTKLLDGVVCCDAPILSTVGLAPGRTTQRTRKRSRNLVAASTTWDRRAQAYRLRVFPFDIGSISPFSFSCHAHVI